MESWRTVWRNGFAPLLTTCQLEVLLKGLLTDDIRLTQGSTTTPPPLMCVLDWPVEGACVIGYAGWQGSGLSKVGDVELYFADLCFRADQALGEPAACRHFLNWFDDTPRDDMRRELAFEIRRELERRPTIELKPLTSAALALA